MGFISKISPDGGATVEKIKDNQAHIFLNCSTARSTAAKTVACSGFELFTGCSVYVRFTSTGTSNPSSGNLTLNINSTGAKPIVIGNSNKTAMTYANAGELCGNKCHQFVYDGTNWVFVGRDSGGGSADAYVSGTTLYIPTSGS